MPKMKTSRAKRLVTATVHRRRRGRQAAWHDQLQRTKFIQPAEPRRCRLRTKDRQELHAYAR